MDFAGVLLVAAMLQGALGSGGKYDLDVDLTTVQILCRHGYSAEAHTIRTDDGYILTLHRIPGAGSRTPVFLQHGLLGSSADWVVAGPGKALAYLLADGGYDVWLGNARGNTHSRSHVTLSTDDTEYWDFSFHEMGVYDLPAAIDHILNHTGQTKLFYVGHSMGTTMFYVMASTRPEYNDKISAMFSLAPVAYMSRMQSPLHLLRPITYSMQYLSRYLRADEFLTQNIFIRQAIKLCRWSGRVEAICGNSVFLLAGFDEEQFNKTLVPVILSHTPAGTSTKTVMHYIQEINSGKFQQYDRGRKGNWDAYRQSLPLEYDLSLVTAPVQLHYSDHDWLADVGDVKELYQNLPNKLGSFLVSHPKFYHLAFLWGKDAKVLVYDKILTRMEEILTPGLPVEDDNIIETD